MATKLLTPAQIKANQAAILASATQGAAQAKTQLATAQADQASVIAGNTALASTIGGTVNSTTGKITLPASGPTIPSGTSVTTVLPPPKATVTSTFTDANGHQIAVMSDGSTKDMGDTQSVADKKVQTQNALQLVNGTLAGFGVDTTGAIGQGIVDLLTKNYDSATINTIIQNPASIKDADPNVVALAQAWQTRFSGNYGPNGRIAQGQSPLSPSEYIATENSYQDILNAAGVPAGFYSSKEQLGSLIGHDIAPTELQDRVNTAAKSISNQDPFYTQTLQNYYGLSSGDMIAHALDPETALPLLQRQTAAATFGAAGNRQNISTDVNTAQQYAALGITQSQAEQGFQQIGTELGTDQKLAAIYSAQGNTFGNAGAQQANLVSATFGGEGSADAAIKLKNLQQQEINAFSGSSGVDKNSLNGSSAGAF